MSECLNIREYVLIMLNIIKYASIYLQKQSTEYARFQYMSDAVQSIRSLNKLLSSYQDRSIQNTVKHLRFSILQKTKSREP